MYKNKNILITGGSAIDIQLWNKTLTSSDLP